MFLFRPFSDVEQFISYCTVLFQAELNESKVMGLQVSLKSFPQLCMHDYDPCLIKSVECTSTEENLSLIRHHVNCTCSHASGHLILNSVCIPRPVRD